MIDPNGWESFGVTPCPDIMPNVFPALHGSPSGKIPQCKKGCKASAQLFTPLYRAIGSHTVWQRTNIPDVPELFAKALKNARRDSASLAGFVIPFRLDGSSPIPGSNVRRKSSSREDILNR